MRKHVLVLIGILYVTGTLIAPNAAAKRECLPYASYGETPIGPMPFPRQRDALKAAIQGWIADCTRDWGRSVFNQSIRCDWAKAKDKKSVCNRVPSGFGGYNHKCQVRGVGCADTLD